MRRLLTGLLFCTTTLLAGLPLSAQAGNPQREDGPEFSVSAWLPSWQPGAVSDVLSQPQVFTGGNLFSWDLTGCTSIRPAQPSASIASAVARLRAAGLTVHGTLTASGLTPQMARRCLGNQQTRWAQVHSLVALARDNRLDGVDIDYEHLALTTSAKTARQLRPLFTTFITDLCTSLHEAQLTCTVTVMARWSDQLTVWRGKAVPWIYDYAALGAQVDRLRVMAYDQHAHQFGPGPIAGLPWVKRIAAWTTTQVPVDKVELGIPTYGRDFSRGEHVHLFASQAVSLAREVGATPRYDPVQRELTYTYRRGGVRHTVWFSSARAVAERTELARDLGLAGTVYWAAGLEQPGTWERVAAALTRTQDTWLAAVGAV